MSEDRRAQVLRAIVEDYVETHEPVGSKALVERHRLGVSPATIRNDMVHLEREGLIAQPYTSAGRIPTDKGYRTFVDQIDEVKPLSGAERRAIRAVIEHPIDIDDMVQRTVRLLAQLTHQVAVVQYPKQSAARIRHVELVALAPNRNLIVLITDTGRVEQRIVDTPTLPGQPLPTEAEQEAMLSAVKQRVNSLVSGALLDQVAGILPDRERELRNVEGQFATDVYRMVAELAAANREQRIVMAGSANLAKSGDFGAAIGPLLEAFEEQVVLLKLLSSMAEDLSDISVRIGEENLIDGLRSTSVISTAYGPLAGDQARLAVLGPTRMNYPTTIAAVRAVARYVSQILAEKSS